MATVTQKPDTISFLRNLKAYKINSSEAVSFKLLKGGKTILEETYYPDATDNITIDIKDVVAQYLKVELPTNDTFSQISSASAVSVLALCVSFREESGALHLQPIG